MAAEATVIFNPLEILNIPLPDAYPCYWSAATLHQRREQCWAMVTFWQPRKALLLPRVIVLPTRQQINAAFAIAYVNGGFDVARAFAADGHWQCRWSPQTSSPHDFAAAFSTIPPRMLRLASPHP